MLTIGAFGKVYKGTITRPGCIVEDVAIKTIKSYVRCGSIYVTIIKMHGFVRRNKLSHNALICHVACHINLTVICMQ